MLVPLTPLLLPGWEVTDFLTSQFSPTGIQRYFQFCGGGVLTPSRPHHIAQTEHIIPSKVKQERLTLTSPLSPAPQGCTAAPWQGVVLPCLTWMPHLCYGAEGVNPFLAHSSDPQGHVVTR